MSDELREKVARAMWHAEALRAAPKSVADRRTIEAFLDSSDENKKHWFSLADAAIAAMPTNAKPLEWVRADGHLDADICDTFGLYQIADGGVLFIGHSGDGVDHGSQEAAKAAAQADFDQRISALQTAPPHTERRD